MQKYKHLSIEKFGRVLLKTGDLDPVYIMLYKAKLSKGTLARWLLAYWWFYSSGVVSTLSVLEGKKFYSLATDMATGTNAPRGAERRHFRGAAAFNAIKWFQKQYPCPEDAVEELSHFAEGKLAPAVIGWITDSWPLFGPWIAFKATDMLERCLGVKVEFKGEDLKLYSTPTQGAFELCQEKKWGTRWGEVDDVAGVVKRLEKEFKNYKAPPDYKRPVNVQEIETCLCKYHSHITGHYPLGKDTREIYHSLKGWESLAKKLRKVCRQEFTKEQLGI